LQSEKLFAWKIDEAGTALTTQRNVEIHHRILYP
jgi:hypothetical protein